MGRYHPEGHITDLGNTRMEETRRRQRRMETSSEGGWGSEGEWNGNGMKTNINIPHC